MHREPCSGSANWESSVWCCWQFLLGTISNSHKSNGAEKGQGRKGGDARGANPRAGGSNNCCQALRKQNWRCSQLLMLSWQYWWMFFLLSSHILCILAVTSFIILDLLTTCCAFWTTCWDSFTEDFPILLFRMNWLGPGEGMYPIHWFLQLLFFPGPNPSIL